MSSDSDTGTQSEKAPILSGRYTEESFSVGKTMGRTETDVFLPIIRAWKLLCKDVAVSEHSVLASRSWVWFRTKIVALTPHGHQRAPCIQPEAPICTASTLFFFFFKKQAAPQSLQPRAQVLMQFLIPAKFTHLPHQQSLWPCPSAF